MTAYCAAFIAGIDANRTVKDELAAAVARRRGRRRIAVTDLVNPRQAYFSRVRPEIQPSPDQLQAMMAGTGFHEVFGRAVSTEEFVEQLVEFEEIVGKIDVFEDAPVELKTTGSMPADVIADRPSHVEQLAMYCTMVAKPRGHLLYYRRAEYGRAPQLRALDLEVRALDEVAREMVRRRDLLRHALATGDYAALPRCEWAGRGCRFEAICGCDRADVLVRAVSGTTVAVEDNPALAQRVREAIVSAPEVTPARRIGLNDLVFPRKAAFRLAAQGRAEEEDDAESRMASWERRGFEEVLNDAVWYGFPDACRRVRVSLGVLRSSVMLFRGVPTLLRTSKRREMIERGRLAADAPHYIDRLGFECALAGSEKGRLIVYYSAIPDDKFMVYDVWYKALDRVRDEMRRRLALLEAGASPEDLPPCPEWMSRLCAYHPRCGCGRAQDSPTSGT